MDKNHISKNVYIAFHNQSLNQIKLQIHHENMHHFKRFFKHYKRIFTDLLELFNQLKISKRKYATLPED